MNQNMLPCGPPSGGVTPSPYNNYPPMQNQQYPNNQQMGPMTGGGYPYGPQAPPQQDPAMMHPGYHTPPQMPSNYSSPGYAQVPQQQPAQNSYTADWMNGNAYNNYSPAPTVAPSVMSHASVGGIPCDGSTMSVNSNMYRMNCMPSRPDSVLSLAPSYSENMDPRFSMIPGMPPPPPSQPQQRPRPTFPQLLGVFENAFQNTGMKGVFIMETHLLAQEVQVMKRNGQKTDGCHQYAQLLSRILVALGSWQVNPVEEGLRLAKSYARMVANLPEDVVVQELLQPGVTPCKSGDDPRGAHIRYLSLAALCPSYAAVLLPTLDTILGYPNPITSLRAHLRNDAFFNDVLFLLGSPNNAPQFRLQEHMYLLSILSLLAKNKKDVKEKLMQFEPHRDGKKLNRDGWKGIVGILFCCVHPKILQSFDERKPLDDPNVRNSLKVIRQLIELLFVLGSTPFSMAVANDIILHNGLTIIASYVQYMFSRSRGDYIIVRKGLKLLATCTALKTDGRPYAPALEQLPNKEVFLQKVLNIFISCEKTEDFFIVSLLSQIIHNLITGVSSIGGILSEGAYFATLVKVFSSLHQATQCLRCTREDVEKWKNYTSLLDSEDTIILVFRKLFKSCEGNIQNVPQDSVRELFSVAVNQVGDVATWTEQPVVSVVHRTILMTISMFKIFGKTSHLSSLVLLNTFNNRQENLLGCTFSIIRSLLEVVKEVENKTIYLPHPVAQKLNIITPAVFELLTTIWKTYANAQIQSDWTVRSSLSNLIINYTSMLFKCLSGSEGKNLKAILPFFETIVCDSDEIASNWSKIPEMVSHFDFRSISQEAEIARAATNVQNRISRSIVPLSAEVFNAMNYDMMDAQSPYFNL